MTAVYERLQNCYESIREKISIQPKIGLVLGSGLGDYAESIQIVSTLDYNQIDGFPVSTVSGHKGRFVFGYVDTVPVVIMQGRVHYYEGYSMEDVVLPIRLMKLMGTEILFLTNAAGGVNYNFHAGDFMMITDQIASFVPSPLIGPNISQLGERFPDMSHIYDPELCQLLRQISHDLKIPLQEGTYIQLTGPNFESPHEIRMCRIIGGDAVGMSTACEALAANHMGMRICGISCISNMASGMTEQPLTHSEVKETADQVAPRFKKLITEAIVRMGKE
ncbi:MAG: purine-nucleoside phosphorylase [Lachnospiraceae bacterium]|jgi:purine-nucleoside phosphorylase|nr:purine-nucleoside phosphorylase [Lachnospiraceae bacterium]